MLILLGLMFALCLPMNVNAALTDNGDGTVTDGRGLMWLQSPGPLFNTWDEAVAWADALVFAGHDDWRLPSADNFNVGYPTDEWDSPNSEWGYLYITEWDNPWGSGGGYSLPPDMATMPDYWDYALYWWTETEDDANNAWAYFTSWDGFTSHNDVYSKDQEFAVTAVRDGTVEPPEEEPPVASFTASPSTAPVDSPINFDATSSFDPDGTIVLYEWDWESDGTYDASSASASESHSYSSDNIYSVTLRVTDDDGLTDTATDSVTVYFEPPNAIPEVPFGTIVVSASLIIALGAFFAMPRLRSKSGHIKP